MEGTVSTDVFLAFVGVVRVAACVALIVLGTVYRRWVILWLGVVASGAMVPYVLASLGHDLSPAIVGLSGTLNTAVLLACVWATIDSRARDEQSLGELSRLRRLLGSVGREAQP